MISKADVKFLKSLQIKKFRKEHACFLVEGAKSVSEVIASDYVVKTVYATRKFLETSELDLGLVEVNDCSADELSKVSTFKSNATILAVVEIPNTKWEQPSANEFVLALDNVNDPGNLGTIIRIADWYGIKKVFCSETTVDLYNSKVIAAAKGSFTRVEVVFTDLNQLLESYQGDVLGAFLEGDNIHTRKEVFTGGMLVMGNEANGISPEISKFVTRKVTIPSFSDTESLNVGVATAVLCDNLKRLTEAPQ